MELRQRQAQMQTRLPARLQAPKLLWLAHVISFEQSTEEEGRGEEDRGGGGVGGWRPGAGCRGADLGLSWGEGLAQGFKVLSGAEGREIRKKDLETRDQVRVNRTLDCWL